MRIPVSEYPNIVSRSTTGVKCPLVSLTRRQIPCLAGHVTPSIGNFGKDSIHPHCRLPWIAIDSHRLPCHIYVFIFSYSFIVRVIYPPASISTYPSTLLKGAHQADGPLKSWAARRGDRCSASWSWRFKRNAGSLVTPFVGVPTRHQNSKNVKTWRWLEQTKNTFSSMLSEDFVGGKWRYENK